ncbi:hypothetical protein QQF64_000190 [Cirrhinus molitorella]|uniref:Ig-like domain-containing protein n=1 Tax=Cirrhinus molitorella TaxID=172907 RepID=A0ABR3NWG9_9TELE
MKIIWTFTLMMIPGVVSSISMTGYSGGGVTITCTYDRKYTANAKYFCKGRKPDIPQIEWCSNLIKTETKDEWVHSGRFSLYDDTTANIFNVTISNLSEQDSGTYQCAADISWIGDSYTEVNLNVLTNTDIPKTTLSQPPPLSSPSSSSPSSSLSVSSLSSVRTPLITGVSNSSPSSFTAAGSSLIVYLVLVLVLILILTGLLLLFFCKKHQTQGGDSSSQAGAGKHDLVSQTGHEYEDIKDTQKQLPTNPSDSSDCVYSTVQERTDDTQNFITSSEDLNYALVNFNKKADCPDSVSLRNNQDYCEYAAVNHLTA